VVRAVSDAVPHLASEIYALRTLLALVFPFFIDFTIIKVTKMISAELHFCICSVVVACLLLLYECVRAASAVVSPSPITMPPPSPPT
jgi:hypothetical protein